MKPLTLPNACAALIAILATGGSLPALASEGGSILMGQVNWGGEPEGGIAVVDDADDPSVRQLTSPPQDVYATDLAPSWSPNGKQLVFLRWSQSETEPYAIYRVDVDGSNLEPVIASQDFIEAVEWGPRSTNLIAFVVNPSGGNCVSVVSPDGSNRRDVLCPKGSDGTPRDISSLQWFPDGKHLLVCTARPGNPSNLRKLAVATGHASLLASLERCPAALDISPDGKQIAWQGRNDNINLLDVATRTSRFLTAGTSPVFSADGKQVAFRKEVTAGEFYPLFVIGIDGSNPQQVTPPDPDGLFLSYTPVEWSIDGSRILVEATQEYDGGDFFSYPIGIVQVGSGSFDAFTSARSHRLAYPGPWFEDEDGAIALGNGVARRNLIGRQGEQKLYKLVVPAGASTLQITTSGGTGDVSLYASQGKAPAPDDAQYWSTQGGTNSETISVAPAAAGTYYIKVVGEQAYRGVNLRASYTP